jgi:hypothetical protein
MNIAMIFPIICIILQNALFMSTLNYTTARSRAIYEEPSSIRQLACYYFLFTPTHH